MNKLNKLKLKRFIEMDVTEMKDLVGGSDTTNYPRCKKRDVEYLVTVLIILVLHGKIARIYQLMVKVDAYNTGST